MAADAEIQVNLADAYVMAPPALADWLVVAPLVIGFLFGALALMQRKNVGVQSAIAIIGLSLMLAADAALFWRVYTEGTVVMTMGRWLPPFGITFAADLLGATFALAGGIVGLAGGVFGLREIGHTHRRYGFYPFLLLMMAGVTSAFLTGDIFNLYVWFEVLLIASFGLLVLGSGRKQLDGATKYAFLNLVATTLFLLAVAYMYGVFGTLNMADIARKSEGLQEVGPQFTIALLFFFAFAMKAAAFPVNFWLPASYHTPRIAVSAVFAGVLTKVGVYALFRIFLTLFPIARDEIALLIAVIAALTMVLGALGALAQNDMRRLLGYLVISGIGLMLAGLALGSFMGLSGAIFYATHSMIVMAALYLLIGMIGYSGGTFSLAAVSGLYKREPALAVLSLILFLAVAGLPPFSGLWPKIMLVKASLDVGIWWLAAAILISGLVTTIAVMRVFAFAFWREAAAGAEMPEVRALPIGLAFLATAFLALLSVAAGFYPEPVIAMTNRVATELADPARYISSVFQ